MGLEARSSRETLSSTASSFTVKTEKKHADTTIAAMNFFFVAILKILKVSPLCAGLNF